MFEKIFPCPICQQLCRLDEIYSLKVEKQNSPNSLSMRMFKQAKFICTYAGCGKSYPLETIHHHEMFECFHRRILCPAQGCNFINNVETVIIHSINCPFHLLYCAICKSLYNVSVLTHDCNIIKSQRSIPSFSNIITKIRHPIIRIIIFFFEIIHTLRHLKIDVKLTVLCSYALQYLTLHLPLFLLNEFFDVKMELQIYHLLLIIILTNLNFAICIHYLLQVIETFFIQIHFVLLIDVFYFVNII